MPQSRAMLMTDAPRAQLEFAPARVTVEDLPGGGFILASPMALKPATHAIDVAG